MKFDIQSCDFFRRLRRFSATTSQQIDLLLGMMRKMIYQHFQSTWLKKCGKKEMVKSSLNPLFQRFEVDDESGEAIVNILCFHRFHVNFLLGTQIWQFSHWSFGQFQNSQQMKWAFGLFLGSHLRQSRIWKNLAILSTISRFFSEFLRPHASIPELTPSESSKYTKSRPSGACNLSASMQIFQNAPNFGRLVMGFFQFVDFLEQNNQLSSWL